MRTRGFCRTLRLATLTVAMVLSLSAMSVLAERQQASTAKPGPPAKAQVASAPPREPDIVKVVHVKYADVDRVVRLLIGYFGVGMRPDSTLKLIALSGSPARVSAAEEAIERLDVPPPPTQNVIVTAYLLMASRRPAADTNFHPGDVSLPPGVEGANLPAQLSDVVKQLHGVLGYRDFRLVHTLTLRTSDGGSATISGVTPIGAEHGNPGVPSSVAMAHADFRVGRAQIVPGEKAPSVSLHHLSLAIWKRGNLLPNGSAGSPDTLANIFTDVDIPPNQQVVVGKTDVFNPDLALFLVLSARVVN